MNRYFVVFWVIVGVFTMADWVIQEKGHDPAVTKWRTALAADIKASEVKDAKAQPSQMEVAMTERK